MRYELSALLLASLASLGVASCSSSSSSSSTTAATADAGAVSGNDAGAAPVADAGPAVDPGGKPNRASASAGEVLQLSADIAALTYSWTTLKSAYLDLATAAPAEYSGTGTLTQEAPSSPRYLMTDSVTAAVMGFLTVADNGTMVARLAIPAINGANRAFAGNAGLHFGSGVLQNSVSVPVLGVANPSSTATSLAGTYNFVSLSCSGKSKGFCNQTKTNQIWNTSVNVPSDALCTTEYGTVVITKGADEESASVAYCAKGNLATTDLSACAGASGTGTATYDTTRGICLITMGTETVSHAAISFKSASNNQKVGWIDTDGGMLGYGQLVIAEQLPMAVSDVSGTYRAESSGFNSSTHTICGNAATGTASVDGVASVASNVPWTGFGTFDQDPTGAAIALMAGSGVFVMRNPNDDPWSFEIGTRVSTAGCP